MKKHFLCLLLSLSTLIVRAQNYQCVKAGAKQYFSNLEGYLRGMRIDSVSTVGPDIVYYPFHTARGYYGPLASLPLNYGGASWFGSKIIQKPDGTFLFNTFWNDTVLIKTQAHTGDSWIFYNDTTNLYYKASLIAEDTVTIGGVLDSVKTIRINAYDTSELLPRILLMAFN